MTDRRRVLCLLIAEVACSTVSTVGVSFASAASNHVLVEPLRLAVTNVDRSRLVLLLYGRHDPLLSAPAAPEQRTLLRSSSGVETRKSSRTAVAI